MQKIINLQKKEKIYILYKKTKILQDIIINL
jgi:hypothetical protein